jgi:hypothetical protein
VLCRHGLVTRHEPGNVNTCVGLIAVRVSAQARRGRATQAALRLPSIWKSTPQRADWNTSEPSCLMRPQRAMDADNEGSLRSRTHAPSLLQTRTVHFSKAAASPDRAQHCSDGWSKGSR